MKQTINLYDLIHQIHVEKKEVVWHAHPFNTGEESTIEGYYRSLCEEIKSHTQTLFQLEVDHYGSGYSSYCDAWFYQQTSDFASDPLKSLENYEGLVVLFHRMLPYYVFMQGSKSWPIHDSLMCSHYLPSRKMLDNLANNAVKNLAQKVEKFLTHRGLIRLNTLALTTPLEIAEKIPSVLVDNYLSYYDGLFYWED